MFRPLSFLVISMLLLMAGCSDACENEIIKRLDSPDRVTTATMFNRGCGATTSDSTNISIFGSNEELTGSGNVFVADDDHGKAMGADWGGPWADIRWTSAGQLLVIYDRKSRTFKTQGHAKGINIKFQQIDRQ